MALWECGWSAGPGWSPLVRLEHRSAQISTESLVSGGVSSTSYSSRGRSARAGGVTPPSAPSPPGPWRTDPRPTPLPSGASSSPGEQKSCVRKTQELWPWGPRVTGSPLSELILQAGISYSGRIPITEARTTRASRAVGNKSLRNIPELAFISDLELWWMRSNHWSVRARVCVHARVLSCSVVSDSFWPQGL